MTEMGERLKIARAKAGFQSARKAAIRFAWPASTYAAHENGQNKFDDENAFKYADAFKVSPGWLLTGEGEMGRGGRATVANSSVQRLHVRWEAAAGAWLEVDTHRDADEFADAPITSGGTANKFLARVKGNSMDLAGMPDGSLAVCLEWAEVGRFPKDDDILLVNQMREGGLMVETTIKKVKVFPDRYELQPHSSQAGYKTIVMPRGDAAEESRRVEILGLVLGAYVDFTR